MKKQILNIVTAIAIGSFLLVSCSENKEVENSMEHHDGMHHEHASAYQCPMNCENGKTYDEPGNCPVCNMKLKEVEQEN